MLSPWYSGQTDPAWTLTFENDAGKAIDLTGATMTVLIRNLTTLQDTPGGGSWTIASPTAGVAVYTPIATDSALPGNYPVEFALIFLYQIGARRGISDPFPWLVMPV